MTDIEIELDENYLNDGPVECDVCGRIFPASALQNGTCFDCDLNETRLPPCEPPQNWAVYNRRQADGTFRPLSEFWEIEK